MLLQTRRVHIQGEGNVSCCCKLDEFTFTVREMFHAVAN